MYGRPGVVSVVGLRRGDRADQREQRRGVRINRRGRERGVRDGERVLPAPGGYVYVCQEEGEDCVLLVGC